MAPLSDNDPHWFLQVDFIDDFFVQSRSDHNVKVTEFKLSKATIFLFNIVLRG